jgi:hypothetical protein
MLVTAGRQHGDWSADYRVFSRANWEVRELFHVVKRRCIEWLPPEQPVVVALDDTKLRKTGKKIPGVSYHRDPMSPPFHTNLIRAQRFVQMSIAIPFENKPTSAARAIPIEFEPAPSAPKPGRKATDEQVAQYKEAKRRQNLSRVAVGMMSRLREDLDGLGQQNRRLVLTVDGSYTNETVLKNLPTNTALIGRIRKDAKFFYPPEAQPTLGRKRLYGQIAPTPEELRLDDSTSWQVVEAFAGGKVRRFQVKTISPLLWKKAGANQAVRLVVVRPYGYRLTKNGDVNRRKAIYLICTDPSLPLENILQWYAWRWDIEVNHRDEKQLIGVGQAQVRSELSVDRVPTFAVASYSLLLVAAGDVYGIGARTPRIKPPKWRERQALKQPRITTGQMLEAFRAPAIPPGPLPNFEHFDRKIARYMKCPKSSITLANAIAYARN